MKLTSILSALSLVGVVAFGLALTLSIAATTVFAVSVGLLLVLTVVSDYTAGPRFAGAIAVRANHRERHALAA